MRNARAFAFLLLMPAVATAQEGTRKEIRDSQARLEQIRLERAKLQQEMEALRSRVRDASTELTNIERQRITSSGALRELDYQALVLGDNVTATTHQRILTKAKLAERQVALQHRLRAIYKRGPLHTVRVLLTSESFGNLLSRYKYLRMMALSERIMLEEVSRLENELTEQERELRISLQQLESLRAEKEGEVNRLQQLERQRVAALAQYKQKQKSTQGRLDQLEKDEAAVANVIAVLERRRREEEARTGAAPAAGTLTTRDLGALAWPVEGQLVFRFGPERKPNGVVLRYNGIGIGAPAGSPVKAVEAGTVVRASNMEGYGLSVFLDHGAGAYTLYLRLKTVSVRVGQKVIAGQVVGTVGGESTTQGPHLEFQVRVPTNGTTQPVDPLSWLRNRQ
jgi:septal ring factor EnvC (AmiA/AmiB activator)